LNEDNNRVGLPSTDMEQDTSNESVGAPETEALDSRVNITVTSYRKRNHDPDGISCKAVLDGLTQKGILEDDSTKEVKKITLESFICKEGEEERTIIEIRGQDEQVHK